jgi:hypothetical protein
MDPRLASFNKAALTGFILSMYRLPLSSKLRATAASAMRQTSTRKNPHLGSALRSYSSKGASSKDSRLYLHVGPSGDCWTGHNVFAAKHLQPDYVKSVEITSASTANVEYLLELLEDHPTWGQDIYDAGALPEELAKIIEEAKEEES